MMRKAISPLLAINIFLNIVVLLIRGNKMSNVTISLKFWLQEDCHILMKNPIQQ